VSTSSELLLSGGSDGTLKFFDLEELNHFATLRGHAAPISDCVLLTEVRSAAASSSIDGAVKLWDASGNHVLDLQPSFAPETPPAPLPMCAYGSSLLCCRGYELHCYDLQEERLTSRFSLPVQLPPLHVSAPHPRRLGGSSLVAVSCLQAGVVYVFDSRLTPAAEAEGEPLPNGVAPPQPLWSELSAASRRSLVGTIQLPQGVACARQLHLDSNMLMLSLDADWVAPAFSRTTSELALYDMRAAGSTAFREAPPSPVWQREVRGEFSCFQCSSDEHRVILGTAHGSVLIWNFNSTRVDEEEAEEDNFFKAPKREKWRAKKKVKGKYPKTQGFSNNKFS